MTIRNRHATVVAYLALVVALSGSAYAAATINSRDVVDNSLKSVDLKNGRGVKGIDVRNNTLTGADIDGSAASIPCPEGMNAVGEDLCYDTVSRTGGVDRDFNGALVTCADAGLRLPTLSEAFQAVSLWPTEGRYWTTNLWNFEQTSRNLVTVVYGDPGSYEVVSIGAFHGVRCVTTRLP